MESQECHEWDPTPLMSNLLRSVGKMESSVCNGGNVYRYKIDIKVSGKLEGATAHSNSIMIKNVLKIKML